MNDSDLSSMLDPTKSDDSNSTTRASHDSDQPTTLPQESKQQVLAVERTITASLWRYPRWAGEVEVSLGAGSGVGSSLMGGFVQQRECAARRGHNRLGRLAAYSSALCGRARDRIILLRGDSTFHRLLAINRLWLDLPKSMYALILDISCTVYKHGRHTRHFLPET
jgi:hypothetical protein